MGWNTQNNNQPNNPSNNQKHSSQVGPPPAYPGLQNQPVLSENKPPPYSPSSNFPPPIFQSQNNLQGFNSKPNIFGSNYKNPNYGNTFGSSGLSGNTYISNNYYKSPGSSLGFSGLLTNALFFGGGLHTGYLLSRRKWSDDDDEKWRATTKAPYFENKVPGAEVILPASAVVGAATAFGLASLLPLNVPADKPLMYCDKNSSDIAQAQILINGKVYQCVNETILVTNLKCLNNTKSPEENETENVNECNDGSSKILQCYPYRTDKIYCSNGTLLSRADIFCNSTTLINGTSNETALTCFEGQLAKKQTAFIPTTTQKPAATTEKSLSFAARTHLWFLKLIGKGDVIEKTTTTEAPDKMQWVPEAMTFPPVVDEKLQNLSEDDRQKLRQELAEDIKKYLAENSTEKNSQVV